MTCSNNSHEAVQLFILECFTKEVTVANPFLPMGD